MKNKVVFKDGKIRSWEDVISFSIVCFLAISILAYYNIWLSLILAIFLITIIFRYIAIIKEKENTITNIIENLEEDFSDIKRQMVFSMPFPMAIINRQDQKIKWYSTSFKDIFNYKDILYQNINKLLDNFDMKRIEKKKEGYFEEILNGKFYEFYYISVETKIKNEDIVFLYAIDNTKKYEAVNKFSLSAMQMMVVQIDNYDELNAVIDDSNKSIVYAEIDNKIVEYFTKFDSYIKKYENDKYLVVTKKSSLDDMKKDKFSIIETVREMTVQNKITPTLSIGIGVGNGNESPINIYKEAMLAIDIALGRGGDQVVIKKDDHLEYFGGKTNAIEKRSKVKSRVVASVLKKLIKDSDKVFVMGHVEPDMDSFGSCLGMLEATRILGKESYMLLKYVSPGIENIYNKVSKKYEGFVEKVITPEQAYKMATPNSLVIVLDNNRIQSTEGPGLLDISDKVVLIDHHRRGTNFIKNAVLSLHEPYASSASELVTEIMFYMFNKMEMESVVADALLAGITVDTKNFYFQTGVRTFEAASILKRQGANSMEVKKIFRDDFETVKAKSEVVAKAQTYKDYIAIGVYDQQKDISNLVAAQSADELLNVFDIQASFVLTRIHEKIHISGRSLGSISVQLILEKLGGGGHLTASAAQLQENDMQKAVDLLKNAIDEYLKEEK